MVSKVHVDILDSEIPVGGSGRRLSATERDKLLRLGVPCTERHIVVRAAVNTPKLGQLYEPTYTAERHVPTGLHIA